MGPARSFGGWVDLDIVANGITVPPTAGDSDAFCATNGTAGFDGWSTHSITVVVDTVVGANTVRILGRASGAATGGWLGDTTLVI